MHPLVRSTLTPILEKQRERVYTRDNKIIDPVFLTDKRLPYADTRKGAGSNPFRRAHVGACKRAGVTDFRPHDWRHHWATWALKNGMDMRTLQTLGGWKDLNMVQRYAAVDMDHAGDQLAKNK